MIENNVDPQKALTKAMLVGVIDNENMVEDSQEHMLELAELVRSLGVEATDSIVVYPRKFCARYIVGSGKAEEISALAHEKNCDCIVFDRWISPSQQRNWEKLSGMAVVDREEIIIDIFAARASTKEAVLQVQLAKMQYVLPRLTGAWTHFSRQYGGSTGGKGEGEKQIELDRRTVKTKISQLEKELEIVRKQRGTQRKNREKNAVPHAAIVGYTNAGKSSLLNALAGASALVENKLFATLDPLTRRAELSETQYILLTDTVGFVRKLPHRLVEAFKSTLEEAVLADFLIIVLDISSKSFEEHWTTTNTVLSELGAEDKEKLIVFNKADLVSDPLVFARARHICPEAINISAKTGIGLLELKNMLKNMSRQNSEIIKLILPPDRHDLVALAHDKTKVLSSSYDENGSLNLVINVSNALKNKFLAYITE